MKNRIALPFLLLTAMLVTGFAFAADGLPSNGIYFGNKDSEPTALAAGFVRENVVVRELEASGLLI